MTLGSIVSIIIVALAWVAFIYFYTLRFEWPLTERRFGDEWLVWHLQTPDNLLSLLKGRKRG